MKYLTFSEIPVWQDSHRLALSIYKLTLRLPSVEKYSLSSQLRRSATSIPANIVEGFYRRTTKDLQSFLYNARGSAGETIYHLLLAKDLGYIPITEYDTLSKSLDDVIRQLSAWIKTLNLQSKVRL